MTRFSRILIQFLDGVSRRRSGDCAGDCSTALGSTVAGSADLRFRSRKGARESSGPLPLRPAYLAIPILALHLAGCQSLPTLPPADLQAPGWKMREGQAVWTPARGASGVAGEILLATHPDGRCLVQFAKPPFTLVIARTEGGAWLVHHPLAHRRSGGRGVHPAGLIWFALAEVMEGHTVSEPFRFESRNGSTWLLVNPETGEALEGFLKP